MHKFSVLSCDQSKVTCCLAGICNCVLLKRYLHEPLRKLNNNEEKNRCLVQNMELKPAFVLFNTC